MSHTTPNTETVIADVPPREFYKPGHRAKCQCARCGGMCEFIDCWNGCEDGYLNLYEQDPLWYDDEYDTPCDICNATGGWWTCCNGDEWCQANPMKGREGMARGQIEWFLVKERS
jgi:hypothetical protein